MRLRRVAGHLSPLALMSADAVLTSSASGEIDAECWKIVSEAVAANDCEKMASVYHPDAVLVNTTGTIAVAAQLVKWGEGMERIRAEGRRASVSFRFGSRQADAATAFESGIFRCAGTNAAHPSEVSGGELALRCGRIGGINMGWC